MKHVLITGSTGAIGSALVPCFTEEPETQLTLLVRAKDDAHLRERAGELHAFWDLDSASPEHESVLSRIAFLRGDVGEPRLGMDEDVWKALAEDLTHIIHAAGNVKLNHPLEEARHHAVDSLKEIVALAQAARSNGRLEKLDYTSTVGVCGRMPGLIPERPLTEPRKYHNTYEQAKAEAEEYLLAEMEEGLPATIHRPSMVVGDSQTGRVLHFQVFYYLSEFFAGKLTRGMLPALGNATLDLIPVDYVARAIYLASKRKDAVGRILHLCSGPKHALRLADLAPRLRAFYASHKEVRAPLSEASRSSFLKKVTAFATGAPKAMQRALKTLPYFVAYLEDEQTFDCAKTQAFFGDALTIPDPESYLEVILKYFQENKKRPATEGS